MADWSEKRRENAAYQAQELQKREARDTELARKLIAEFLALPTTQKPTPSKLQARDFSGKRTYRTSVIGWYLKQNKSVAISTTGEFYVLLVEKTLRNKIFGATPNPGTPPLVLGAGGRDGESIDLKDALGKLVN